MPFHHKGPVGASDARICTNNGASGDPDYYADLGLIHTATFAEIKRAFHSLAKRYHPDKQGLGVCCDAYDFRRIRAAFEFLRDAAKRSIYDVSYPRLRQRWAEYHKWEGMERHTQELRRAEDVARRRKLAEAELRRQKEEEQQKAWEKILRERQAAQEKEARKRAEEVRLAKEKEERERARKVKEELAEQRTKEAAQRAREQQEHAARERLRKLMERDAELRSQEVARKARLERQLVAEARLKAALIEEKQDSTRKTWAKIREAAELRQAIQRQAGQAQTETPNPLQRDHSHPLGWLRKTGKAICVFCSGKCSKFYFFCPQCDSTACQACKIR